MTTTLGSIGQLAPGASSLETLVTVPAGKAVVCSSLIVCNRNAAATTFRVAVRVGGAAISDEHYLYYDVDINGNTTFTAVLGITLAAADVVSVYAGNANLSFNLFGQVITY